METITDSQNKRIKKFLESGKSLTDFDAIYLFGCRRLASRINELKKMGVDIAPTEMIEVISHGQIKRVGKYYIKKK